MGRAFMRVNDNHTIYIITYMADYKYLLELIRISKETKNSVILPRARLSGVDLRGADLRDAVLTAVDLSGANLENANLTGARLTGANLSGANLRGADFFRDGDVNPILSRVDLKRADLSGADFTQANLKLADLTDADLTDTNFSKAILIGVDLTRVKNFTRYSNGKRDNLRGTILVHAINVPDSFRKAKTRKCREL
jgi:uncharacterized protein YjbI with pentapeptide repeats